MPGGLVGDGNPSWPPAGATLTRRWLGSLDHGRPGPTLVVVGGVHGNEPAGVVAIKRVIHELRKRRLALRGRLMGLAGNIRALSHNARYMDHDLNRGWSVDARARMRGMPREDRSPEDNERRELLEIFHRLDEQFDHPLIFMDLHSFSAEGPPFCVAADTLRNRAIAHGLQAPMILGLDESVEGTMLGYLTDLGHVTVGFEGGQHDDPRTVENHVAAIWIALVNAGLLRREQVDELPRCEARLGRAAAGLPRAVELVYRHSIGAADGFRMDPGFCNFQSVRRGQRLAVDRAGEVRSPSGGRILLPLYQGQGQDGFFIARNLGPAELRLVSTLRRLELDRLLPYLPGVDRGAGREDELRLGSGGLGRPVKQVLRMFGYRRERSAEGELRLARRRQAESRRRAAAE